MLDRLLWELENFRALQPTRQRLRVLPLIRHKKRPGLLQVIKLLKDPEAVLLVQVVGALPGEVLAAVVAQVLCLPLVMFSRKVRNPR